MPVFGGIREKMHNFIREKKLKKLTVPLRKTCGLAKAGKVGIIFKYSTPEINLKVLQLCDNLKQRNIQTDVLAYVSNPKKHLQKHKPQLPVFTNKDLTWFWFPKSRQVMDFVNKDFDILISLCTEKCVPVEAVAALSSAGFRVGSYSDRSVPCFDFMIDSSHKKQTDKVLEEIIHYLNMVQT